ncbi:hypothetical protein BO82DRAFT_399665 [Aspergillus uvarum CBS 121591]|uniref:Uncharacterized protein n=1 Tax=Aspergillus uvarum CBS 121591 TaxID=1448315 RepID=A0A319DZX3_9EURO|nr:hypothetical protein BO82DRAFT_399665 [Aspergillus uvarum CBS 121591]PYH84422.1 hypothetical protein BO82DRAFT_399665 [Aspergillus uvarum CBS 121591]
MDQHRAIAHPRTSHYILFPPIALALTLHGRGSPENPAACMRLVPPIGEPYFDTQILTGFRSVFTDPVKAEGLDLHPRPATERLDSSSSGDSTAQTNPTTPGGSSADESSPSTASFLLEECDQAIDQDLAAGTDSYPTKVDTGSLSPFARTGEQIATLLAVEADEIKLDAPVAALGVNTLIATALRKWLATGKGATGPIPVSEGGVYGGRLPPSSK